MGKFVNNFDIQTYNPLTSYEKYDVVCVILEVYPIYFVSTKDSNIGSLNTETYASNAFWKRFDDVSFVINSVWSPSFETSLKSETRPRTIPLGDGYIQKINLGLFFNKLSYEMTINSCTTKELKSLLIFCEYKGGIDFALVDVPPFISGRKFVIKNWRHAYNSDNLNSFSANLFEFASDKNV